MFFMPKDKRRLDCQEKVYYYELCEECKRKEITYVIRKMRKRINSI